MKNGERTPTFSLPRPTARAAGLSLGVLLTVLTAAAHATDWGTPGLDGAHSRLSTESSGAAFGDGRWAYTPPSRGRALASPVTADGYLVSADLDGTVTALQANSGALAWQVSLGSAVQGTPAVANGRVFVPAIGGAIVALGLTDGRQLHWRCTGGHKNWQDNTFDFELVPLDDGRTRLRFTQNYATELSDDDYGVYNYNWGYYLESLRLLCTAGAGKPFEVPE